MPVITGASTVKLIVVLLATPPTVTFTGPVVAVVNEDGTVAVIRLADQALVVAVQPLIVTVLVPGVAPKPLPLIWICVPGNPLAGLTPVTETGPTVKIVLVLLLVPLTVTLTPPVVAPVGTLATICVLLQLAIVVAATLLNEIVP
jgi:hypothetical protein